MGGPCACSLFLILCIITTTVTDGFKGVGGAEHNGQVRSCHEREKQALLKFKQSFSSDPFNRLSSWVEEQDCCLWSGVACNNVTGHVTKLDLRNIQQDDGYEFPIDEKALKGNVLNPCLLELPSLSYLDLSGNDFNYTAIPSFLGSFTRLRHLDLSNAMFHGRVPYQIGNLSNLQYLGLESDLYVNDLDWLSNLSSLKHLDMSGIHLGNITHWFDNINRLTSLTELHLGYCSVGEISSFTTTINFTSIEVLHLSSNHLRCHDLKLVQNLTYLLQLDLSYNDLDCPIPHVFNKMAFLTQLDLSMNQLEGTITDVFSGLMNLVDLRLSYNNLIGHLPDVFRGMASLKLLDLSNNKFIGHLPDVFGGMASLTILDLGSNNFSGSLPQSINQLLELRVLDVSSNSLDGVISESHLSNLSKLQRIDISFNSLHCKFSSDWIPPLQLNEIKMPSCSMGPLVPAWLQSLKNLSNLDISDNGIRGTIPSWYWSISSTMTHMDLSHNHIVGKLPYLHNVASRSPSSHRIIIDLSSNQLEGPIPQISPNITSLNLSKNRFSGSLSSFLCNAKSLSSFNQLSFLDLSENLLSGEIPDCWMYWSAITILNLANNTFSEEIPRSMGLIQDMYMLILRNNNFTGDLHFLSKNFTHLGLLDVSDNRLSGSIPKWIGELQRLKVLMLRSNELDGSIPAQLCQLGNLHILDLAHNKLQGNIPNCLGNFSALTEARLETSLIGNVWPRFGNQEYEARVMLLWKGREYEFKEILLLVKMIDLSSNQLYGVIPEELTNLLELVALNLSRNNLTGTIPNKVGSLKKLDFLDFSRNRLSGHIPMDMSNLTSLGVLDLSNNNLSGEIPQSTQFQRFDASSFTGNSELCGLPLPKKCETPHQAPPLTIDDEDDIPIWFYIGLGMGYSVGISGVFLCLVLNRSWRIVYFGFVEKVTDWVYVVTVVNKRKLQRRMSSCTTAETYYEGDCG